MIADLPAPRLALVSSRATTLARHIPAFLLGLSFFCWAHLTFHRQTFPGSTAFQDVELYVAPVIALAITAGAWLSGQRQSSRWLAAGGLVWLGAGLAAGRGAPDPVLALTWLPWLAIALGLLMSSIDRYAMAAGMAIGAVASVPLMVFQAFAQTTWPTALIQAWAGGELSPVVRGAAVLGDERWLRPYGLMPHPNVAGGIAAVACVLLACGWLRDHRLWQIAAVSAAFAGVLLSFSRSAWLGAVAGLLVLMWLRRGNVKALVAAVVLPALLFGVTLSGFVVQRASASGTLEDDSLSQRVYLVQTTLLLWRQHPLVGIGPLQFRQAEVDLYGPSFIPEPAHNALLLVLAETGVVGLAGCGLVISGVVRRMLGARDWDTAAAGVALIPPLMLDHYLMTTSVGLVLVAAALSGSSTATARS